MTVKDDVALVWTEKSQRDAFFRARGILEEATTAVNDALSEFKAIKASGKFNTLPATVISTMLAWETAFDKCKAEILANSNIIDVYSWRP